MIYSFDVFDTLITRRVLRPTDLFLLQARELIREGAWNAPESDWQRLRVDAELRARARRRGGEITLESIYDELRLLRDLPTEIIARAYALETALEAKCAVFIEANCRRLQALVNSGHRVVLASDMYLPRSCMREILKCAGLEGLPLYLSSEHGTTKSSGGLFKVLAAAEQAALPHVSHHGDNILSDYKVPKRLGVAAKHYAGQQPTLSERMTYEDSSIGDKKLRSLLAGAMRTARLANPHAHETHAASVWNVAANIVGPLVTAFVLWVLARARARGLQRIYFVARDGQIAWRVAKLLCEQWNMPIDCRYLYGSRQAWHLPSVTRLDDHTHAWILQRTPGTTLQIVLARVGMGATAIATAADRLELAPHDRIDEHMERVRGFLTSMEPTICERAAEARGLVRDYFVQEGLADGAPYGIVDIGWKGRLQRSLSSILTACGMYPPNGVPGYYVGLIGTPPALERDTLDAYLFSDSHRPPQLPRGYLALYELMFSADHPGVDGFAVDDGRIVPRLRADYLLLDHEWPLHAQQDGVMRFAGDFANAAPYLDQQHFELAPAVARLLERFLTMPTHEEAVAYGTAMFSQEQTEGAHRELAPPLTLRDLALLATRRATSRQARSLWLEGSIHRTPSVLRSALLAALRHRH